MTIHVGILGGGGISDTHARAAQDLPDTRVVAVFGQNAERAARLAAAHGAIPYPDLAAFLAHRPLDLVLIGSPPGAHVAEVQAAARAGLHVLCEKPLGITTDEVESMVEACGEAGVRLGVFFQDRTQPDFVRLKSFLDEGGLGRVHLVTSHVKWYRGPEYYSASRWRGIPALEGGGAVMSQGIHTLDLLLWLLGDVARVYAAARTAVHAVKVEDTAVATFEFASDAIGSFEATTSVYPGERRRVEISGSQGTIRIEHDRVVAADLKPGGLSFEASAPSGSAESAASPVVSDATPHRRILENFLEAIRTGRRPACDGREGRRSVALVQAIYESARAGVPVSVT